MSLTHCIMRPNHTEQDSSGMMQANISEDYAIQMGAS